MSISAMNQALEALEGLWDDGFGGVPESMHKDAITALRQAIAEAEKQEPVAWIVDGEIKVRLDMAGKLYYSETNVYATPVHASDISQERVDETAKCKHEPVAWFIQYEYRHEFLWREPTDYEKNSALEIKPLYTAPPISDYHEGWEEGFKAAKREWVGLTDEEKSDIDAKSIGIRSAMYLTEATLKEKNK